MSRSQPEPPSTEGQGRRVLINVIGAIGLVFGALAIVRYLLDLDIFDLAVAPYEWLGLEGPMRLVPPAMVLVTCLAAAFFLERGAGRD